MHRLRPIRDEVVVRVVEEQVAKAGDLYLPDQSREDSRQAVVIEVGPMAEGVVERGDLVLMPKTGVAQVRIDERVFQIVKESEIIAVIEE